MSDLNVQIESLSPVVRRLKIDVAATRVDKVTDSVYRRLGQTVKLKGFRQGHVPRRVLEKYFADQVRSDVAREIVQSTFKEALGTTDLNPVAEPTVEPEALTPGEAFHYTARVEVRPEVQLAEYKGLEVSVTEQKVADADVDRAVEQMRESAAVLTPVEGRDVADWGDSAVVNWEILVPGRKPEKREQGMTTVEPGAFTSGHGEKLHGRKIGELIEFSEKFGDTEDQEAQLKVTITGLKRKQVPNLDDEFAKDVRGVETVDELRKSVRSELEERAHMEQDRLTRTALIERLLEKNPVEVPPALVDFTARRMAHEFVDRLERRGLKIPNGMDIVEKLKADSIGRATVDVKTFFLLDAIASAEKIEVSAEDTEHKLEEIADEEGEPVGRVKLRYRTAQAQASLKELVRNDKAFDLVKRDAKIALHEEAPPAAAPAT